MKYDELFEEMGDVGYRKTKEDAINNIREAIQGYIAALKEDGLSVDKFINLL